MPGCSCYQPASLLLVCAPVCVISNLDLLHAASLGDLWRFDGVPTDRADPSGANYDGVPFVFLSGDREPDSPPQYCPRAPCTGPDIHPGSRYGAIGWTHRDGKLWLFGGRGFANAVESSAGCSSACTYLADHWSVDARDGVWTWEGGSERDAAGTSYQASGSNHPHPGSRMMAGGWTDSRHDTAYMLGGLGHVTSSSGGHMNDLWTFNMSLVSPATSHAPAPSLNLYQSVATSGVST